MVNRLDIDSCKIKLLERQQELLATQGEQAEGMAPKELDQTRVGRLSRMDAMQQQAMSKAAAALAAVELQRIKTALARIDAGEYGYCILCEEEITPRRLDFDPSLLTCIGCAQKTEDGQ